MLVRRSNLLVPLHDPERVRTAWKCDADAITLDVRNVARATLGREYVEAIAAASRGAAEVFIATHSTSFESDVERAVKPGLAGLVLTGIASADDVVRADGLVDEIERRQGYAAGALRFVVLLCSAGAVWDVRSILNATRRIVQIGLDECALAESMRIPLRNDCDPFVYARGRLVIEAVAARVAPIGFAYPLSARPHLPCGVDAIHELALKAKNLGFKGVLCANEEWVAPINAAFTPTPELVAWNKRVREAFAAGVVAGTAAVPLEGRMIDVPVDEWAKVVLESAEACAARDAQKRAARERLSAARDH